MKFIMKLQHSILVILESSLYIDERVPAVKKTKMKKNNLTIEDSPKTAHR